MNQRIRELAEQAGMWRQAYDIGEESPAGLEKFAELIVGECISAVENTNDRYRRDYFAQKIKQHFGIEP